jgi:glutamine phosphoribosylpyrophosphate amidotransferase
MAAPGCVAVVPTGCGRPGPHPLLDLAAPFLRLPPARLVIRPGRQGRDPDVSRFYAERGRLQANVLLLEDSWVSGSSAQSAAAALKRAGAGRVAVIVLGRHLDPADRFGAALAARAAETPYDPGRCAVHDVQRTREIASL